MRRILTVVALSFLAAGTCAAQEPARVEQVTVNVGEAVTVALDPGRAGQISIVERGPASDEASAASGDSEGANSASAVTNVLRISLERGGHGMMMSVENRSDQLLRYRARIERGRRSARTSVCPVMPNGSGYESWPDSFDRVVLSEFRLVRVSEGQTVTLTCE